MVDISQQQITNEAATFLEAGHYFQTTAYDTSLLITDDERYDAFHHFELFDRKILWINPVFYEMQGKKVVLMPRTIFKCDPDNFDGALVKNRFASLLCYVTSATSINPSTYAGIAHPAPCVVQPQQMISAMRYTHDQIDMVIRRRSPGSFTDKKWIALAHYRQGVIANTPYFNYLSLWKILELYFDNRRTTIDTHIDTTLGTRPDWLNDPDLAGDTPAVRLRAIRNMSAHFALDGGATQDPDNPDLSNQADEGRYPLKRIVEDLIDTGSW